MSGHQLKELLQSARDAENSENEERAAELYQQIVDEHPHSRAAKIAGERLMELEDEPRARRESDENPPQTDEWTCTQCGHTEFIEGELNGGSAVFFEPDGSEDALRQNNAVCARVCRSCGTVEPYLDGSTLVG